MYCRYLLVHVCVLVVVLHVASLQWKVVKEKVLQLSQLTTIYEVTVNKARSFPRLHLHVKIVISINLQKSRTKILHCKVVIF